MMGKFLLWVLILNTLLRSSESHQADGATNFEVVKPVRLTTTQYPWPQTLKYALTVGGRYIEMHLVKNNELFSPDYVETWYKDDGTRVTERPTEIDLCYYSGMIVNDSDSSVSISNCDGLSGYFRTSTHSYLIEPLSGHGDDKGDHVVATLNEQSGTLGVCGVNATWSHFQSPTKEKSSRVPRWVDQQKYIELYLVADNRVYKKMKRDKIKLRKKMYDIINHVNKLYKPLRTFIALVGMEIWSQRDQITLVPDTGDNLFKFNMWRRFHLKHRHDHAQLISAINFDDDLTGLAYIGGICSDKSAGIVQDHDPDARKVGATLAHEIGHNLGLDHDDYSVCTCPVRPCVMDDARHTSAPNHFSSCSVTQYQGFLREHRPTCILDKPDYRNLLMPKFCGNGFVEQGEECDCGTVEECINPCCNPHTCKMMPKAQCTTGNCCKNCTISPRFTECRRAEDECDLAEYCDGRSATCPEDVYAANGLPCDGDLGYCHDGRCPQRSKQCIQLYGTNAQVAPSVCYEENGKGNYHGFCMRPLDDLFIPCLREDELCGKIYCSEGTENPFHGKVMKIGECKTATFAFRSVDHALVNDGTKCGDQKVCKKNACIDLQTAYTNTNCSAQCKGHAICNHRRECQCEPGWMPPNCDSQDYVEEPTVLSGASASIAVTISLLVLVAGGGANF